MVERIMEDGKVLRVRRDEGVGVSTERWPRVGGGTFSSVPATQLTGITALYCHNTSLAGMS